VKVTDAFIGTQLAGVQRSSATAQAIILRSPGGFHLSRLTTADGQRQAQLWRFASLYDLLLFARAKGFTEVDPDAEDWQPVAASS
jgi:hypothetical protein